MIYHILVKYRFCINIILAVTSRAWYMHAHTHTKQSVQTEELEINEPTPKGKDHR